ncbi:RCC1 repeat-containing protein [Bifidobacterium margollesii]|uniref:RCC1 repeat-containing protein n=1 Tax=Bifidobacterium margollesii TaxID=2020964 RepID=A0A2N5JD27_9BIFI|nr:Ig-like domain-containing protein [Bifidobacterium margollesii]PLS32116.1 RCC1 repeat-containing protein [Bifidobacterium margollesii]
MNKGRGLSGVMLRGMIALVCAVATLLASNVLAGTANAASKLPAKPVQIAANYNGDSGPDVTAAPNVLLSDGTVWTMNANLVTYQREGFTGIKKIAAGSAGSRALTRNGDMVDLFDGRTLLSGVAESTFNEDADGFVVRTNGTVFAPSGTGYETKYLPVNGLSGVRSVSVDDTNKIAYATLSDGGVVRFSASIPNDASNRTSLNLGAARVPGLSGVRSVTAGDGYYLALMADGTVKASGSNVVGQLGLGDRKERSTPVTVPGLSDVKTLSTTNESGRTHYGTSYALSGNGRVYTWGVGDYGQLGHAYSYADNGFTTGSVSPTPVDGLTNARMLYAQSTYADNEPRAMAITTDGKVRSWGVGFGSNQPQYGNPGAKLDDFSRVGSAIDIAVDGSNYWAATAFVLTDDGSIYACGHSTYGVTGSNIATRTPFGDNVQGSSDSKAKVSSSLTYVSSPAWFANGEYIGSKIPMSITVTNEQASDRHEDRSLTISSVKVTLPKGLSFSQTKEERVRDIRSLLDPVTLQPYKSVTAKFDVYIPDSYLHTYVKSFDASAAVVTTAGEVSAKASLPVNRTDADLTLVRKIEQWNANADVSSELDKLSDETMTQLWYNRYSVAAQNQHMDVLSGMWNLIDAATQGNLVASRNMTQNEAKDLILATLYDSDDLITGASRDNFIEEFNDAARQWAQDQLEQNTSEEQRTGLKILAAALASPKVVQEQYDSFSGYANRVKEVYDQVATDQEKISDQARINRMFGSTFQQMQRAQNFLQRFNRLSKVAELYGKGADKLEKLGKINDYLGTAKDLNDSWNNIQRLMEMQDRVGLYVGILDSIQKKATIPAVRAAAGDAATTIQLNGDKFVDEFFGILDDKASEQIDEKIGEWVAKKCPYVAIAQVTSEVMTGTLLKSTVNAAATAKTMRIQTDIAYALAMRYNTSMRSFEQERTDPVAKLDDAKSVLYSLAMLLNIHEKGETTFSDPSFAQSDGGWAQPAQRDNAAINVKEIQTLEKNLIAPDSTWYSSSPHLWYATVLCPLNVEVRRNGRLVVVLTNQTASVDNADGHFETIVRDGDAKKMMVLYGAPSEYSFTLKGTGHGTAMIDMDVQNGGKRIEHRSQYLKVAPNSRFTVSSVRADGNYGVQVDANGDGKPESTSNAVTLNQGRITVPTGITLSEKTMSLTVGETSSVGVSITPTNATLPGVQWFSSDPKIASVDPSGKILGLRKGAATITAKSGNVSSTLTVVVDKKEIVRRVPVYRVYNRNSGLHHYTVSKAENDMLIRIGWRDENRGGSAFVTVSRDTPGARPVYREYNRRSGNHNWTLNKKEHDMLVRLGWRDEGIAWYTSPTGRDVYRLYNPKPYHKPKNGRGNGGGEHVYTTSYGEYRAVVRAGWRGEGVAWKSL